MPAELYAQIYRCYGDVLVRRDLGNITVIFQVS
jgi:hypothetical protein